MKSRKWIGENMIPLSGIILAISGSVLAQCNVASQLKESRHARLPFLSVDKVELFSRGKGSSEIVVTWSNSGGTEALDAETTAAWSASGSVRENRNLKPESFFLASHASTSATRISLSPTIVEGIRRGKERFELRWATSYRDKFGYDKDDRHQTRQAWTLSRIDADPRRIPIDKPIDVLFEAIPGGACVDSGCSEY